MVKQWINRVLSIWEQILGKVKTESMSSTTRTEQAEVPEVERRGVSDSRWWH